MARRKMQSHLRRTEKSSKDDQYWHNLYSKTLESAEDSGAEDIVEDLKNFENRPEEILRRLSIISKADLEREFPDDKDE